MPWPLTARALVVPLLLSLTVGRCGAARAHARSAERWQRVELRLNASWLHRAREVMGSAAEGACPLHGSARAESWRLESRGGSMQVSGCSGAGLCRRSASATAWVARQVRVLQRQLPEMEGVVCEISQQLASALPTQRLWASHGGSAVELGAGRGDAPNMSEAPESSNECAICWEEIRQARHLPCGHTFCRECIRIWGRRSNQCPYCLGPIRSWLVRMERALVILSKANMSVFLLSLGSFVFSFPVADRIFAMAWFVAGAIMALDGAVNLCRHW